MPPKSSNLQKKNFKLEEVFDTLYLFILLGVVLFGGYVFFVAPDQYTKDELIKMTYYCIPVFMFAAVGLIKVRNDNSLLYASIALVVSVVLIVLYFEIFYPVFPALGV